MPNATHCQTCGHPVPPDSSNGECPQCLLGLVFGGEEVSSKAAKRLGDYEIGEEIARGGMGVVYRAWQTNVNRPVALKMISSGELASSETIQRFRVEAEAAGNLHHPHIVTILEVGEEDGLPYLTMPLVDGGNLAQELPKIGLASLGTASSSTVGQAQRNLARLMAKVARAVAYAHQHGVLHRDLKPTNILLDEQGEPQLTDFGLAKLVESDRSALTLSTSALGSPSYMAPEQTRGEATTASDIYGIGAVLYELLTGMPPFRGHTAVETIRQVLETAPRPPQQIHPLVSTDLQTICLKCLEKHPAQRYASAEQLAEDLERYERGEPVAARPVGTLGQIWRWSRRQPTTAALSLGLLVAFLAGFAGVAWQWMVADGAKQEAQENALAMRHTLSRSDFRKASEILESGATKSALPYLARALRTDPDYWQAAHLLVDTLSYRRLHWQVKEPIVHEHPIVHWEMNDSRDRLLVWDEAGYSSLWDVVNWKRIPRPEDGVKLAEAPRFEDTNDLNSLPEGLAFAPSERRVSPDGLFTTVLSEDRRQVAWWGKNGILIHTSLPLPILHATPDSEREVMVLIIEGNEHAEHRTLNLSDGSEEARATLPLLHRVLLPEDVHGTTGLAPAFGVLTNDGWVQIRDWLNGELVQSLAAPPGGYREATLSPDGSRCAMLDSEGYLRCFDLFTGDSWNGEAPLTKAEQVRFSPEGERLIVTGEEMPLRCWHARRDFELVEPAQLDGTVSGVQIAADGETAIIHESYATIESRGSASGTALSQIRALPLEPAVMHDNYLSSGAAFAQYSDDGKWIATVQDWGSHSIQLWDSETLSCVHTWPRGQLAYRTAFSPNGRLLVTAGEDGAVAVYDTNSGDLLAEFQHALPARDVCFSPDSSHVATLISQKDEGSSLTVWHCDSGLAVLGPQVISDGSAYSIRYTSDGERIVLCSEEAVMWVRPSDGQEWRVPLFAAAMKTGGQFNGEGSVCAGPMGYLAAGIAYNGQVLNVVDGKTQGSLAEFAAGGTATRQVRFSPSGQLIAAAAENRLNVWEWLSARKRFETIELGFDPIRIRFDARGKRFAAGGSLLSISRGQGRARIWDVDTGVPLGAPIELQTSLREIAFHPEGDQLVYTTATGAGGVWVRSLIPPSEPIPEWMPQFAEAVAGQSLDNEGGIINQSSQSCDQFLNDKRSSASENRYARWVSWFLAEPDARPVSLTSNQSRDTYFKNILSRNRLDEVREVLRICPNIAESWLRLGFLQRGQEPLILLPQCLREQNEWSAKWYVRQGAKRNPEGAKAMTVEMKESESERSRYIREKRALVEKHLSPRPKEATASHIDLTPYYTRALSPKSEVANRAAFIDLPPFDRLIGKGDIRFDVRGVIALAGEQTPQHLRYVQEIPINATCRRLHLAHGLAWGRNLPHRLEYAQLVIHFEDGSTSNWSLRAGLDAYDWRNDPRPPQRAKVAWEGTSPSGSDVRLSHSSWTNPYPDKVVRHVDLISRVTKGAPFIAGLTLE